MIVGVLCAASPLILEKALAAIEENSIDILELRLDYLEKYSLAELKETVKKNKAKLLLTLRSYREGGKYQGTEEERLQELSLAAEALCPNFIDLELSIPASWIASFQLKYPDIQVILSHHDFQKTPQNMDDIFLQMTRHASAAFYKMAFFSQSTLDALRLLVFLQGKNEQKNIIGIAMGEKSLASRILSPIFGSPLVYCHLDSLPQSAPGQLSVTEALSIYHQKSLNKNTKIYGLIGDPVEQSIGHIFHNQQIKKENKNAVYVKWQLSSQELPQAVPLLKQLQISGLSVTMPLKEEILKFLDKLSPEVQMIRAANTITVEDEKWCGHNTDGSGVFDLLPGDLKRIAVLGAGGAARAIIFAAQQRGIDIFVFNRSLEKRKDYFSYITSGIALYPLEAFVQVQEKTPFDVVINTLPFSIPLPFSIDNINYFDINYASSLPSQNGLQVFLHQAVYQRILWD